MPTKEYYAANRERLSALSRKRYKENPEVFRLKSLKWRSKNPELKRRLSREWNAANRQRCRANKNRWHRENKSRVRAYESNRRRTNYDVRFAAFVRTRVSEALKQAGTYKKSKTFDLVGCSLSELKAWLESHFLPGMTWANRGYWGWHIDHKKPCRAFNLSDPEEQKKCFHYTNLQPLWWRDNLTKQGKYTP